MLMGFRLGSATGSQTRERRAWENEERTLFPGPLSVFPQAVCISTGGHSCSQGSLSPGHSPSGINLASFLAPHPTRTSSPAHCCDPLHTGLHLSKHPHLNVPYVFCWRGIQGLWEEDCTTKTLGGRGRRETWS